MHLQDQQLYLAPIKTSHIVTSLTEKSEHQSNSMSPMVFSYYSAL